jgi:hypothetical protein
MKYFTRERYAAMQNSDDEAVRRADEDWEAAVDQYNAYLQSIRPELSDSVRQLLDGFFLHDATVLSMGRRGDRFVISLQLDVPPNEVLTIVYHLAGPPDARKEAFPWRADEVPALLWLYEELELVGEGEARHFVQRILFDNGWELDLPFRDVELSTVYPMFPAPRAATAPLTPTA